MPRVDWDALGSFFVSYPSSIEEQDRIAWTLGQHLDLLDDARDAGRSVLRLSHERSLAIAANAIAELARDAPLVELRRVLRHVEQGWSPEAEDRSAEEGEWGVLKLSAIKRGEFRPGEHKALPSGLDPRSGIEVRDGDLLVTRANTLETVADACVVRAPPPNLMMSDLIYRLTPDPRRADPDYLCLWLLSRHARQQIEADARGTSLSMVKVSQDLLRRWLVPLPHLDVQREVVERVKVAQAQAKGVMDDARATISLLVERRAALVQAAVSGRLPVPRDNPARILEAV
jgi:type I restriction enzyme S subunit